MHRLAAYIILILMIRIIKANLSANQIQFGNNKKTNVISSLFANDHDQYINELLFPRIHKRFIHFNRLNNNKHHRNLKSLRKSTNIISAILMFGR
jgi:hypothetical protein